METLINLFQSLPFPALFFIGLAIRLYVGMKQFNRRGAGGLQHFSNYFIGLITLAIEWVLSWAALALMLWGLWGWVFR